MKEVLITTTSFADTPGAHHERLKTLGWNLTWARGPLSEDEIFELVGDYDGIICGDDVYSRRVLEKALPKLQFLSKYGIGVDKIDVAAATDLGLPVLFTPGVNHTTVAEHTFMLMLMLVKQAVPHVNAVQQGVWKRQTGNEIFGKTIGVVGLGRIGKEVTIRAKAFGLNVIGYDVYWDEAFANEHQVERATTYDQIWETADFISLHTSLNDETHHLINRESIAKMKAGVFIVNCARGEIVNTVELVDALKSGQIAGYGADVLDEEPPSKNHPMLGVENCIITPHIGSRTYESVVRQATKSIENLALAFDGKTPLAQVNEVPIAG